ncbi:MAG: hypothetical protein HY823_04210 [Acidobacteria bacterium]|nr:hypothetical protein [Acidobacteriota bacterium]
MLIPPLAANALGLAVGFHRRGRLDPPLRWLVAYLFLCLLTTLGMVALAAVRGNNWALVHLFAPVQLLGFAWMFSGWVPGWMGRTFRWTAVSFALAWLWFLPQEDLTRFSGISFHVQTLLMLGGSLGALFHFSLQADRPLLDHPGAWVASGLLGDMSITLVSYASRAWLLAHAPDWAFNLNLFRAMVVTLAYLCFLRALLLEPLLPLPSDGR